MTSLKDFDYEDIKIIGRGQYGKAHLVRRGKDQGTFIAKTIDLTCLSSKERETALQEVALLRRLDHPNIVAYKDNFFMADTLVIIMEYCEGGDLANYIKDMGKQKTRIREVQIMNYFVQVLQSLQYIHNERILHRDLKTSNLFLMHSKKVVKLGDFGISRVLEGTFEAAMTVVGTPYYMSPEVCENKPYTYKSDVWALGCVLYELCMLKHAFSADNLLGLVYKIVSDKYEPIPKMYSQNLNALIQRMLEKNDAKRPSVRELLADPYVHSFMNEYVRTRGQCASGSRAHTAAAGSAGSASGIASDSARGIGACSPGDGAIAPAQVPTSGEQRVVRRPARPAGSVAKRPPSEGGGGSKNETPKEAALRRKREAADRQAAELKTAARESLQNKMVARKMKEAEFQTTRSGTAMGALAQGLVAPGGTTTASIPPSTNDYDDDSGSLTPEEELLEEIDEEDFSEEYEDDFEDDFGSDDDIAGEGTDLEKYGAAGGGIGVLSTVREEQDFTRVMTNYEQDLARVTTVASPVPRHSVGGTAAAQSTVATPSATPAQPSGAIISMQTRADRLREELVRKMGAATFEKAFAIIFESRSKNTLLDKRSLEALVGRENYKTYCFEIDQLVFQKLVYLG